MQTRSIFGLAAVLSGLACDPGTYYLGPALTIVSPAPGGTVTPSMNNTVPVEFRVAEFTLLKAGTCAGAPSCGHVHMKVDGDACNNTYAGKTYNVSGFASPLVANLALCPQPSGPHQAQLELHNDDHSAVAGAASASLRFTAAVRTTLAILAPAAGASVTMAADHTVPVAFAASNFTLKMAGTCTPTDGACGHVHLWVDDHACDNVAAGKMYNVSGYVSPLNANLALCPTVLGMHKVTIELHNNDHSPVMDAASSMVVGANITITAQ